MYEERILERVKKDTYGGVFKKANGKLIRIAAHVCDGTKILGTGINSSKSHPVMEIYNKYLPYNRKCCLHAEVAAMVNSGWKPGSDILKSTTIYVARKLNIQGFGYSRPCQACMRAIKDAKIKKIVYTTESGYAVEVIKY